MCLRAHKKITSGSRSAPFRLMLIQSGSPKILLWLSAKSLPVQGLFLQGWDDFSILAKWIAIKKMLFEHFFEEYLVPEPK